MPYSSMMAGGLFSEIMDDKELISSQYDVIAGRLPERYDELLMVLTDKSHITDFLEYTRGLRDPAELSEMVRKIMAGETVEKADGCGYNEKNRF